MATDSPPTQPPEEPDEGAPVEQAHAQPEEPVVRPTPEVIHETPGRAEIVPRRRLICPYLGLREDRTVVAIMPTAAHACYAGRRPFTPALEHQAYLCLGGRYPACRYFPKPTPGPVNQYDPFFQPERARSRVPWGVWAALVAVLIVLAGVAGAYIGGGRLPFTVVIQMQPSPTPGAAAAQAPPTATPTFTPEPPTLTPTAAPAAAAVAPAGAEAAPAAAPVEQRAPGAEAEGQVLTLSPRPVDVGWWASQSQRGSIGDSFLYAGVSEGQAYVSAVRFDLRRVARGTEIQDATLTLTGLRAPALDPASGASWVVQLVAENSLPQLPGSSFFDVFGAPAEFDLTPSVTAANVAVGEANTWALDAAARAWIEQQLLDGATAIIVRIAPAAVDGDTLFAWDSGQGSESRGAPPQLILGLGPPPPTPPPTNTPVVMVATLTPEPANVLTVVAMTLMPEGQAFTPTPVAVEIRTPTPFPENLATVQAAALAEGRPAVLLDTPVPANAATATADAAYATAVALTTGTFTPVPTAYVTPALYYPSPPPENVATAAARALTATAVAMRGTPTPTLPWNAVAAVYAYATPTPGNLETAVAQVQEANASAATTGTPTPTPWNLVVITPVPQPTPTPIPLIVAASRLTPTPTATATRVLLAADFERLRGQIVFLSNRTGDVQTWAMDPATGETAALITDERVHPLAREAFLPWSPDGKERAFVVLVGLEDQEDNFQIRIENLEYGLTRDLTYFPRAANYDPAWSPAGNWIAFVSTQDGNDEIYIVRPDGQEATRLTYNSWEWDKHPTWSPDGGQIAFYSNRETGRRQIWVMDADGSDQRNLSQNEFEDWDPVWIR